MIKNSIKTALRGFRSNPLFTAFNLISLVTSITVIYIALGYLNFETSYDEFHKNSESIYRLGRTLRSQDYSVIGFERSEAEDQINQINQVARLADFSSVNRATQFYISQASEFVRFNGNEIAVDEILTTNTPQTFTEIFTWKLKQGNFEDFYKNINSVIITEDVAKILFYKTDKTSPIQKIIDIAGEDYLVAAIIENVPGNSHFDFSMALNKERIDYWGSQIYLQAKKGFDQVEIEKQINDGVASFNPAMAKNPIYKRHFIQPITSIHLESNILYELKQPGNFNYVLLIGFFVIFILGISVFNYSNFTLAIKTKQSKDIGVKKVMGASSNAIGRQFVFEGVLLALIAVPISGVLLPLIIPAFNDLMEVSLSTNIFGNYIIVGAIILLAMCIGLLASILPALYLSNMDPTKLFQNNFKDKGFQEFSTRKYLVISQFVIIIGISSISYFVLNQVNFISEKDLGFNKENILYTYTSEENLDLFQEKLRQIPEISEVGNGSSLAIGTYNKLNYKLEGIETVYDDANQLYMDYSALKAYGIKTSLSQTVLNNFSEQTRRTIINRTAAEKFAKLKGVTIDNLIGLTVVTEPDYTSEEGVVGFPFTIDGIFEDINVFSLREQIEPYFITLSNRVRMNGNTIIALNSGGSNDALDKIRGVYEELNEPYPLDIEFLDTNYKALHAQDKQTGDLVFLLNVIAVFLALLGIIGITLLLIVGRTKEIGIRKVLGASATSILKISIKEYVGFIAIATLISWPISYMVIKSWLSNFAYRISIDQWVFGAIALSILLATATIVGLISLKTALSNPVDNLRTE